MRRIEHKGPLRRAVRPMPEKQPTLDEGRQVRACLLLVEVYLCDLRRPVAHAHLGAVRAPPIRRGARIREVGAHVDELDARNALVCLELSRDAVLLRSAKWQAWHIVRLSSS